MHIKLDAPQTKLYDGCAKFWQTMQECFEHAIEQLDSIDGWVAPKHSMAQVSGMPRAPALLQAAPDSS